jgi:alkyl hydroperoxide reductase subunit AhpC
LIANYDAFVERNTEVLLVFPGAKDQISSFRQASLELTDATSFPFPVLLDEDLSVVNRLGIASDLANPSTFIIDRLGQVRYSYVGKYTSDRPSIKAMLLQLDGLVGAEASLSNQNNSPGDASSRNVTPTSGDSRESASLNNASNTNRTG